LEVGKIYPRAGFDAVTFEKSTGRNEVFIQCNAHRLFNIIAENESAPFRGLLFNSQVGGNPWGFSHNEELLARFGADTGNSTQTIKFYKNLELNDNSDLDVEGTKNFNIPHPIKPDMRLVHTCIESPYAGLQYSGMVTFTQGKASVSLDATFGMTPGTFAVLTRRIRRTTTNETGTAAVCSRFDVKDSRLDVYTPGDPNSSDEICWMIVAERNDEIIKKNTSTDSDGNLIVEKKKKVLKAETASEDD